MLYPLITVIFCVLIEQITRIALKDFIQLSYNSGAAFGILHNVPKVALIFSCIVCLIIFFMLAFVKLKPVVKFGLSVMLGGAVSNLIERIFFGHVIDWIPLPFPFTILFSDLNFNLADVEISLGALIAFLFSI